MYRYHSLPDESMLYQLYQKTLKGLSLFTVLGAELNRDGSLADIQLFHLDKILTVALKEMDQGQVRKTLEQIKHRYAILRQLNPDNYNAPSWFTDKW